MTAFWHVEHPAHRSPLSWIVDVLIAVFAGLSAVPYLMRAEPGQPTLSALIVIGLVVAPLTARRICPLPVFAWVVLSAELANLWDNGVLAGFAVLVALYTVATLLPRVVAIGCAGLVELGIIASAIATTGWDWWYHVIPLTGLLAAAVGLGLYTATRQAYLRELRVRADRLERERDQQSALAAAAERARITREMHDIVAHHLTVMVALSDGAMAATARSPQTGIDAMEEVSATGRRALADTRRLLGVLRDDSADAARELRMPMPDLSELDGLIERVRAAGLPTTLEVRGSASSAATAVQVTAYRLVQEALTNTLKHGGPGAHAAVSLQHRPNHLLISVDDDGAGPGAPTPTTAGGGLAGMRERVLAYGGDLEAGPRSPTGWRVCATLLLDESDESDQSDESDESDDS